MTTIISEEQEKIINMISSNNLVVDCVVGSGKTTTIIEIAKRYKNLKILLMVYNKKLRQETCDKVSFLKNIEVHSFHSYCYNYYENVKNADYSTDFGLLSIIKNKKSFNKIFDYDLLIIDEAQDLNKIYYDIIHIALLNKIKEPRIALFGDSNQSIYEYNGSDCRFLKLASIMFDSKYEWINASLNETFRLNKGHINLLTLLNCTTNIYTRKEDKVLPRYIICNQYTNRPLREVLYYIEQGYKYSDILILAPTLKVLKKLINKLSDQNIPLYCSEGTSQFSDSKVILCTFHQAKGLERKVVIIFNFDNSYYKYYNKTGNTQKCTNELYVAITRSSERLSLIHHYKNGFIEPLKTKSSIYLNVLMPKLFQIEYYLNHDLSKIYNLKNSNNFSSNSFSISVSDLIKHLPVNVISKIISKMNIIKINKEEEIITVPKITIGSTSYEYVADITGIMIPMYYEYITTGKCTIEEIVCQNMYKSFKVPDNIVPFKEEEEVSENDADGCDFILNDDNDDDNYDNDDDDNVEKDHFEDSFGDLQKITSDIPEEDMIKRMLKLATKWKSISDGTIYKLNQISNYNWISKYIIDKCTKRMSKYISNDAMYEIFHNKVSESSINIGNLNVSLNIYGYIDCIDKDSIWEFKCCETIDPIYFIQLLLYIYITDKYDIDHYLFNILTGEVYTVSTSKIEMKILLIKLLDSKYIYKNKISSDENFINENLFI